MNPISYVSSLVYGTNDGKNRSGINEAIANLKEQLDGETQSEALHERDSEAAGKIDALYQAHPHQLIAVLKQQDPPLLGEAIKAGFNEVAKALLKLVPSDIEGRDASRKTPLILAAESGNKPIFEALLRAGASVHATDARGCTALIWAAMTGIVDFVKSLFGAGAIQIVDAQDNAGNTALMAAISRGHLEIATMLIREGHANVSLANHAGDTALSLATGRGDTDLIGPLCSSGADVNAPDPEGFSPLIRAIQAGNLKMIVALVLNGADANVRDRDKRTIPYYLVACKESFSDGQYERAFACLGVAALRAMGDTTAM
ncbi:ankyrin repeat domain-containing protein [Bordetella tumulicola]|uniref:ankyrin repeat domain-containing protein n=1 Tax=Bordetella tumulicola TaxID=1649133 RepID=UPI0039EF73C8